ncbi:DUF2062 domain-containing protein [Sphingorhabdus lacus]|jgi:uncharacterized protein (DUF2062 family)|uniref:DUF2062 domain-containing protein n=1 Tax=Sphingorhabdus lacus TaxID=392610 RepID=A0A6I6L2Y1_9SPHN|nr:DUF2062 domain-containing protein [Sphingorhabdus lacus]QGY80160.1 DUF2062 domain-containing protein [Sphingorhabdus lacus]HPV67724.1 DUF2062 domain-containing protein [Sphingorhabdus lacus]
MSKFGAWIQRQAPTRDSFERSRFLRPFAQRVFHPALWRFTRRSVPRGVALGLLVGIFLLIPGVQIAGVALLALPVRANIPIGAAMTFLSMPATTPFILFASVYVGESVLRLSGGSGRFYELIETSAPLSAWMDFVWTEAPMALVQGVAGLAIISVVAAALGYVLAAWFWRWWISSKWRRRSKALAAGG